MVVGNPRALVPLAHAHVPFPLAFGYLYCSRRWRGAVKAGGAHCVLPGIFAASIAFYFKTNN